MALVVSGSDFLVDIFSKEQVPSLYLYLVVAILCCTRGNTMGNKNYIYKTILKINKYLLLFSDLLLSATMQPVFWHHTTGRTYTIPTLRENVDDKSESRNPASRFRQFSVGASLPNPCISPQSG